MGEAFMSVYNNLDFPPDFVLLANHRSYRDHLFLAPTSGAPLRQHPSPYTQQEAAQQPCPSEHF
jgi:hypothetical protein